MLNCAAIMGRLVADPELHSTINGVSVVSFTIAVDRNYVAQGEERQADFIDIVAWRGTADFVCKYFHKGSMIAVQGSIQTRNYEDKNGNKRKSTEIIADNVSFCGKKEEAKASDINIKDDEDEGNVEMSEPTVVYNAGSSVPEDVTVSEDDLPF